MNGIEALWSLPFARPVAWALAHFLWQGALVGILLAGALALSKKKSPSARYAMAAGAMGLLLALPVITALSLAPSGEVSPASVAPAALSAPADETGPVIAAAVSVARESAVSASASRLQPLLPWLFVFWLAGVGVLSFYHLGGWLQARRLESRGTRPVPERWERVVAELSRRLGIARAVRILESSRVAVPAVVGWLRPVILVPASALAGLSPQQLEAILAHELAHVRRHDYLINLLQTVVETLLFYHPAVWWVSRVVRQEREHCCDDLAVAVCGDRIVYVRALADLEGLRAPSPRLAMASDGGSLLGRIRRLAGAPSGPSGRRSWLAGALALGLLPSGMVVRIGVPAEGADPAAGRKAVAAEAAAPAPAPVPVRIAAAAPRAPEPAPAPQAAPAPAPAREVRPGSEQGVWTGEIKEDGRVQLQLKSRSKGEKEWGFGNSFSASDLQGLHSGRFELRRDAGTLTFEGRFDGTGPGAQGTGTFSFQPDPGYIRDMASLGYRVEDKVFELALFDVSRASVRELRSLGYDDLTLQNLIEFAIFRVTPDFIREVGALGFQDLPAKRLVEMRIHRVTPEYFREMAALGYKDLSLNDAVSFRIHRINPEFVREMAALGYENLSADELVSFRIFQVTPEFVRELAELGYRDVPAEDLTELRIHRVNSDFIREAREKEGRDLSLRELVDLKIQGHIRKGRGRK